MANKFRTIFNPQANKTVVLIGEVVVAILNDRTAAETLCIELNNLVHDYVANQALAYDSINK